MTTTTTALHAPLFRGDKLEVVTIGALVGFLAASQLSVAPAYIMLAITFACWAAVVRVHHERVQVPTMFWWLAAYGVATALLGPQLGPTPPLSLVDCKQLVLFLIVPVVYRFARGQRALTFATVIISVGALSAIIGIAQFGLLHFDNLSKPAARHADPLHDLFGRADAGGLRRRRPARLPPRGARLLRRLADLDGAGDAGADRRAGLTFTRSAWVGTGGRRRRSSSCSRIAGCSPPSRWWWR